VSDYKREVWEGLCGSNIPTKACCS